MNNSDVHSISENTVENNGTHSPALTGKARSLANLKPWKPGESGGGGGRPKTADLREIVLADFRKDPAGNVERLKKERIDLYFAYAFGKPVERLQLSAEVETNRISPEDIALARALVRERLGLDMPKALDVTA